MTSSVPRALARSLSIFPTLAHMADPNGVEFAIAVPSDDKSKKKSDETPVVNGFGKEPEANVSATELVCDCISRSATPV